MNVSSVDGSLDAHNINIGCVCRAIKRASTLVLAAKQKQTIKVQPRQGSIGKRNGQADIAEVPFLDRFHISVTGFPFPLGPFFQRRTVRKEVTPVQRALHELCIF